MIRKNSLNEMLVTVVSFRSDCDLAEILRAKCEMKFGPSRCGVRDASFVRSFGREMLFRPRLPSFLNRLEREGLHGALRRTGRIPSTCERFPPVWFSRDRARTHCPSTRVSARTGSEVPGTWQDSSFLDCRWCKFFFSFSLL